MACTVQSVRPSCSLSGIATSSRTKAIAPKFVGLGNTTLPVRVPLKSRSNVRVSRASVSVKASAELHSAVNDIVNVVYTLADTADATAEVVIKDNGWLEPVVGVLEFVLKAIDGALEKFGVPYSYGFAIILLTLGVKVATFPLSKQQVESTLAMQSLAPAIKQLQKTYAFDKERLQMETAKLYKDAGVNPLAGCLPTLATLPVWIGLYRALSNVADEGMLSEGFFWVPSLAGPASIASRDAGGGLSWLLPLGENGPPIGWHDALAYLVLPVLLVVSQYASQAIISPPSAQDESQAQTTAILKFLPLMIGWFALNVPSGLSLYWITNNVLTTAQQVYLRNSTPSPATAAAGGGGGGGMFGSMFSQDEGGDAIDVTPTSTSSSSPSSAKTLNPAAADPAVSAGESRKDRRARERDERRGKRFAERKASEAKAKVPANSSSSDDSTPPTPPSAPSA
mmetsp:Transcript_2106/g.2962  ORF Transcript_2106/g.2962 Transcript_2106/m.2962 type:complete len:453 (+) Transcript_2106:94-1452(+)|eukprot:CAMPEP_0196579130 /NCGR_PEP_ID=MMETSP1081-20130531/17666_1 /TAXON_ID=36882 /ORGANISM="Pyramimonas amylifera, Strain CCMP720" /LENGTH=452 /DNA_ID=CAMNT_0041898601 /DNA_START=92 /DNA_END=1450 /DNA_ORIENTATION=-